MKATKVDGIYDADPMVKTRRRPLRAHLVPRRCSSSGCKVMDATAISLCMDNRLPIVVFNLRDAGQHPPRDHRAKPIGSLVTA